MLAKELNDIMTGLGWSGADLAERVDAHPVTVSAWRTGKAPVPGAVAYAVTLARDLCILVDRLAPRPSRRPRRRPAPRRRAT